MKLPSVIALKDYIIPQSNLVLLDLMFLQTNFVNIMQGEELTFDHLLPRSKGGETNCTML